MGSSGAARNPGNSAIVRIAVEDLAAHVATLEAELREAHMIELTRGETVIATILPAPPLEAKQVRSVEMPDFMARLRKIYGDKPGAFDTTKWIREDRDDRL